MNEDTVLVMASVLIEEAERFNFFNAELIRSIRKNMAFHASMDCLGIDSDEHTYSSDYEVCDMTEVVADVHQSIGIPFTNYNSPLIDFIFAMAESIEKGTFK